MICTISAAEVSAETTERIALRLQKELDQLEGGLLQEKDKRKRIEEDMRGLVSDLDSMNM